MFYSISKDSEQDSMTEDSSCWMWF